MWMLCVQAFDGYVRDTTAKLQRKVEDLEDVRNVMGILKEVRAQPASPLPQPPSSLPALVVTM